MLPAELRGTQVLSGCINADVKEDKNKRDYLPPPQNQVVHNVKIPVSVQTNSNNVIQEGTHFELNILRTVPYIAPAYTLLQTHTRTQVHTARGNLFLQCLLCDVVTLKLKPGP